MRWSVAEAKQRLSEVLRATAEEPQLIFNRDRMVAAVVDAASYEAFQVWKRKQGGSIREATEELRRIAAEENYVLEVPPRNDRPNAFWEMLSELEDEADNTQR